MKKFFINLILILIGLLILFLQSNFFNFFTIAGTKPNIFIIYILFIGLFGNKIMGITYGIILGVFLDLLFKQTIGPNLLGFVFISIIATIFDKNFSKDSRITIMLMVFGTTLVFEFVAYFTSYILYNINFEIWSFIKIASIEVFYNILITIIIYPLIQKFGYYVENEYKGNKILTRYF